jgi:hypothetical protein
VITLLLLTALVTFIEIKHVSTSSTKVRNNIFTIFEVCEVDSSKMRESTAGVVDGELDENFYVLTLSSKAQPVERSSSRGKLLQGSASNQMNSNQAQQNLNSHRQLMNQDLYYETGSAKLSNS